MNIGEIRTEIHQHLLRPVILAHCPLAERSWIAHALDAWLRDDPPAPNSAKEILTALDTNLKAAEGYLDGVSELAVMGNWRLTSKGKEVFTIPRVGLLERSCSTTGATTAVNCRFTSDCWKSLFP
jgi:hypothetical protein